MIRIATLLYPFKLHGNEVHWGISLVFIFVFGLSIGLAFIRKNRQNLPRRITSLLLLFLGLTGLIWQPAIREINRGQKVIILTDHYSKSALSRLTLQETSAQTVYLLKQATLAPQGNAPHDVQDLLYRYPGIDEVWILGDGLENDQLKSLEGRKIHYVPSKKEHEGISRIQWPNSLIQNKIATLKGYYHLPESSEKRWIHLAYEGAPLDSSLVNKQKGYNFSLSFNPKSSGQFIFDLLIKDEKGKAIGQENLALEIKPQVQLRILFLNSSPLFETKYLKNYLAEEGHKVWVRSQISQDRFKDDLNNTQEAIGGLSQSFLNQLDLILVDHKFLRQAQGLFMNRLEKAIREHGSSLWVQLTEEPPLWQPLSILQASFQHKFSIVQTFPIRNVHNTIKQKTSLETMEREFISQASDEILLRSPKGSIVSIAKTYGLGKIGTSLVSESYPILLKGHKKSYQYYWTQILEKLLRQADVNKNWEFDEPVIVQEPFDFHFETLNPEAYQKVINPQLEETPVPLAQDAYLSHRWSGRFWPHNRGWHTLMEPGPNDSLSRSFYVYSQEAWTYLRREKVRKVNQMAAANSIKSDLTNTSFQYEIYHKISPIWFYILILLGLSYLWIEPKL